MARPWPKRSAWPYVAKSGRKSYAVGFYDHDRRERSRSFASVRHARGWMDEYMIAERRGRESLRRFLLDLDAKEANEKTLARSIAEVLELYLEVNAHPRNEGGLAPSTYERYEQVIGLHLLGKPRVRTQGETRRAPGYAVKVASVPARSFNGPQAPRAWREDMLIAGVPKPTRDKAWSVLSAALSWAASSQLVAEIQTNGCGLANEPRVNRRRSMRAGGTGYAPAPRRRGLGVAGWALSPQAVEAIRAQMLRPVGRRELLAQRDAMVVSLQYGLGARNQEVWGLRWASLAEEFAWVIEVLSSGQLTEWGKTEHSTERRTAVPSILREDLTGWRAALQRDGHPAGELDFIIPGDLSGPGRGALDPRTGACHFSENQARSWGARFFTPAVQKVAVRPEFLSILGATPYSLRRGGISLRLRAEDPQTVASECGTSLQMLSEHYAFAIEDLRRQGPRPVDVEWRAARAAQADHDAARASAVDAPPERKLRGRFAARRGASTVRRIAGRDSGNTQIGRPAGRSPQDLTGEQRVDMAGNVIADRTDLIKRTSLGIGELPPVPWTRDDSTGWDWAGMTDRCVGSRFAAGECLSGLSPCVGDDPGGVVPGRGRSG